MNSEMNAIADAGRPLTRQKVFAVLNSKSGSCAIADVRLAIEESMSTSDVEIHEIAQGDDLRAIVRSAVDRGCDPIIAAGGDGTISSVADVLVGTEAHLIVFPLGTANVFARELGIPVELKGACQLGASYLETQLEIRRIDVMKIEGRHYITQVGVGIDSLMIRDTDTEQKRRFGRLAYIWTGLKQLVGLHPIRFTITVDDRTIIARGSQVLVANTGMMGQDPFRWGPDISPDDGRLNVCIVRARSMAHYLNLFWHVLRGSQKRSPHVRYEVATRSVVIEAKTPLPIQADGEILGTTPVRIEVVPLAIQVVVPSTT